MMRTRDFSKTGDAIEVPDLGDVQIAAYTRFLQPDRLPEERENIGLEAVFREFFPLDGPDGVLRMEYLGYDLGAPLRDERECRDLGLTYAFPLRARFRIVGPESVEEDVYLGDIPTMIGGGAFVVNGSERVIVAQIQRSPGVDFSGTVVPGGDTTYSCRFVPERGTWLEFGVSRKDTLQVRLGQSGRMPATWLLRAMLPERATDADILAIFFARETVSLQGPDALADVEGRYLAGDIVNSETGESLAMAGAQITAEMAQAFRASGMAAVVLLKDVSDPLLLRTLAADPCKSYAEALMRIYARFRPGEPVSLDRAAEFFAMRFADPRHYSLGKVGRFRINRKFQQDVPTDVLTLCPEDILNAMRYLIKLRGREGAPDDIDDLGNRVLRAIDKLLEAALRDGFMRWCHVLQERLVMTDSGAPSPRAIAGTRAITNVIDSFFSRSELSQVADQTNPLAQLNHMRRISALGPGGLNRKRAGFEVRDVHASHYGRICPIETPEGPNIGLIASLGIFARVDEYGFITTPYVKASDSDETGQVRHIRADEEKTLRVAPATRNGGDSMVLARFGGEFRKAGLNEIDLTDVSPKQIVGVSASLIPFLEHNDANRALMGSNMQRQAVPLVRTEQPLVATGMEEAVARNSGMVVRARREGTVAEVDANHIRIGEDTYPLRKFLRLNEDICLNQKPIVRLGQQVKAGEVVADGAATSGGELSLGRNVLVAFMIWDGYNFEDAIIISEGLIQADKYTSIHIEEFTAELHETRLGPEEFTNDIPNVPARMLGDLDENGIVRIGTKVMPDDILVGKVTPKSKTELTPEERLVREIFGKAGIDVANESLTVPPGSGGVVVDVRTFQRRRNLSDQERSDDRREAGKTKREYDEKIASAFSGMVRALSELPRLTERGLPAVGDNATTREGLRLESVFDFSLSDFAPESRPRAREIYMASHRRIEALKAQRDQQVRKLRVGDELPPGVMQMVKVYVAVKRPLAAGDKIAGRHGNKGVVARIVPREDMPFLSDGTPVEIILNPLGVPSRMNVGQILETHLGWAGEVLGFRAVTPVFDGATEDEIRACLREAALPEDGKAVLCDGRTGEPFDQEVTVGFIYMMKLNHLVEDKVHARATGPYSLITQQPLGGKSRMGGQRLGEMEVWALEAYGAAHTLQEMLTVKSDDVDGRGRMYEAIIKRKNVLEVGTPVSFDVLVQEMRGLGLNLRLTRAAEPRAAGKKSSAVSPRKEVSEPAVERR